MDRTLKNRGTEAIAWHNHTIMSKMHGETIVQYFFVIDRCMNICKRAYSSGHLVWINIPLHIYFQRAMEGLVIFKFNVHHSVIFTSTLLLAYIIYFCRHPCTELSAACSNYTENGSNQPFQTGWEMDGCDERWLNLYASFHRHMIPQNYDYGTSVAALATLHRIRLMPHVKPYRQEISIGV